MSTLTAAPFVLVPRLIPPPKIIYLKGLALLQRAIYVSDAVGTAGSSILSIAQILGASDVNNRRDDLKGLLIFHRGQFMQLIEGARTDLDRLLKRLRADPRHENIRMMVDGPVEGAPVGAQPMVQVTVSGEVETLIGDRTLDRLSLPQVEAIFTTAATLVDLAA